MKRLSLKGVVVFICILAVAGIPAWLLPQTDAAAMRPSIESQAVPVSAPAATPTPGFQINSILQSR